MNTEKTIQTLLSEEGFTLKNENLVPFKEKEDFQTVLDFVDVEKGEVYSFTVTNGTSEAFACNPESLKAYKNNLLISVE